MRLSHIALLCCAATFGIILTTNTSSAKTAKMCEADWKANKPSIQAKGTKKKDFIAGCRAEGDTAAPTKERTRATKTEPHITTATTAKGCEEQWKANKPAIQASGKKKKDFISECRTGVAAKPTPARQDNQTAAPPRSTTSRENTAPTRETTSPSAGTPTAANQYASEGAAKLRCPLDTVVWVNTRSGIYHFSGHKDFGGTKSGAYMCEKDTGASGFRAAKNEKHP